MQLKQNYLLFIKMKVFKVIYFQFKIKKNHNVCKTNQLLQYYFMKINDRLIYLITDYLKMKFKHAN